jgi:nitrogen fixation/metabolism regulation signal transduction histidine kinase
MSKGWESKAVEEQQAERERPVDDRPKIDGHKERARQELELQREQILSARTANPHRRAALEAALQQVETALARIDNRPAQL